MCVLCALAVPTRAPSSLFPETLDRLPWPDGGDVVGSIEWTGVAGFVLDVGGTRIAFDPFVTRPGLFSTLFRRARPDGDEVARRLPRLDAVFVGHTHFDHAMDLAEVARTSPRARVHGGATTAELCRRLGVEASRVEAVADGDVVDVGPFRVSAVRAEHGVVPVVRLVDRVELPDEGVPRTPFRWPRGEVFAYRVEVSGRSFHVQGSAGLDDAALARQRPCDVLIACLAARRGTPGYLDRLGERLRPRILIPCHHDDFFRPLSEAPRPIATLREHAFRDEADRLRAAHGTAVVPLPRCRPVPF